ncbi:MAG TPA: ABC transporter permease subunit [Candidatus Limnocylindrales bacterium]|nr:ABC transporter permease subunit [Candidatus Limnocylindrales bacterium]
MAERLGLAALAAALLGLVVLPLLDLFGTALSAGAGAALESLRGVAGEAMLTTLLIGLAVTAGSLAVGALAAFATERENVPGRGWLRVGMLMPLLVPGFVSALSWIGAYGPGGLAHDLFGFELPGLFGAPGVVAVLVVETVPITYLVIAGALAAHGEPDAERAARAAGAGRWGTLRSVTLPLLAPALAAAAVLAFVSAVNAFGVPAILGTPARLVTVTVRIYQDLALSADPAAFVRATVLASVLVLLAVVTVSAADALFSTGRAVRTGAPSGPMPAGRRGRLVAGALWLYLVLAVVLPLVALGLASITRAVGLPPLPEYWTLDNYGAALTGRTASALGNSALLAATGATAAVLLGSLLAALRAGRLRRGLSVAAALPFAVPGSALAVAVLLAYGPWLRDTLLLIGIAYLAKFWALGHRSLVGAADGLAGAPLQAARASGATRLDALRSIVLPLMRPALLGAWLAVFVLALHELTMSSLLHGPGSQTLAVVILNLQQLGDVPTTSALAVVLTLVGLVAGGTFLLVGRRAPA